MPQTHNETDGKCFVVSPRYQVAFVDADAVFLVDERGYIALQGTGVVAVLRCLQRAPCTVETVARQVADMLPADEACAIMARLLGDGHVIEHHDDIESQEIAYWHYGGVDPRQAADRLRQARVALRAFGPIDGTSLAHHLCRMNIEVISPALLHQMQVDLALICTDDYLRAEVQAFNREAWAARQPWMLVKPVGATIWLGPLIAPDRTACAACLAAQLLENRRAEVFLRQTQGRTTPLITSIAGLPGTGDLALNLAALEIIQGLAREGHDRLENTFLTFDLTALNLEKHHVRRLPRCPVCGPPAAGTSRPSVAHEDRHPRRRPPHPDAGSRVR
ncbi:MAG: TOMM precursor leader peptide-binding protein [Rhodothermales bacterium]